MNIDQAIRLFVNYLNNSWLNVFPLLKDRGYTTDEDSINDWLQANWEILVERKVLQLNEYLEVYGDGADFNGNSSRITDIDAISTSRVRVVAKDGNNCFDFLSNENILLDNMTFDRIVSFKYGFYSLEPDFKYVLITDISGQERVIDMNEVEFVLENLRKGVS